MIEALIARIGLESPGGWNAPDIDRAIHFDLLGNEGNLSCDHCGTVRFILVPRYTSSIDDALKLVPRGWQVDNLFIGTDKSARLDLRNLNDPNAPLINGSGESAPVAICIAALRARAAA